LVLKPLIESAVYGAPPGAAAFILTGGYGGINPHYRILKNTIFHGKSFEILVALLGLSPADGAPPVPIVSITG